jgi:DNA helicase-2/ATP-dependent DNA helicase PcrA
MNHQESFNHFFSTQLNPAQQQAVAQKDGSLLIIAGAGSGKTRVITSRIINLMLNEHVPPYAIVALTFTNKAAIEMKERIAAMLGSGPKPFIGTFHAYCLHLLRTNPHLAPFSPFAILDADDQQSMLQGLIKRAKIEKKITAKNLGYQISMKKNSGTQQPEHALSQQEQIFEQLYAAYEKEKKLNKVIDFDDLLIEVNKLFANNVSFKEKFQANVRHILVDEYQDTNNIQHTLLKHMTLINNQQFTVDSLCVVGDEDQSIYSWRGATVANIMNFTSDFPNTTIVKIEQNYRSVQPILQIANQVIQHNTYRNPKNIWSKKEAHDRARIITCLSGYQESEAFAHLVKVVRKEKKQQTIAILYRAHYQSRMIEEALIRHSIPYKIIGGIQFYERKEIKDILAYLRLIANSFDRISFFRIYNVPQRGLGKKFEEEFDACWQQEPLFTFFEVGQQLINAGELSGKKAAEMQDFIALIQALNYESKPSDCINHILATTQYFSYLKATFDPVEAEAKIENVKELLRAVAYFEEQGINTVALLLHEITLMQEKIALSKDHHDHVQLMTLHAAKGLEFDIIALSGLEEGLFPSTHSLYDPASIEEERRLFYVGITRAKEHILFSHARYRYTFGTMNDQTSSRFLDEIPEHLAHRTDASGWDTLQSSSFFSQWLSAEMPEKRSPIITFGAAKTINTQQSSERPAESSIAWREKQSVRHPKFGIGIIKSLERKDSTTIYADVQFKTGLKKIKADFLKPA